MKKNWISPKLSNYGSVEELTQVGKSFGGRDGVCFEPKTNGPGVPVGPFS